MRALHWPCLFVTTWPWLTKTMTRDEIKLFLSKIELNQITTKSQKSTWCAHQGYLEYSACMWVKVMREFCRMQ